MNLNMKILIGEEINTPIGRSNQVDTVITHWTEVDPSDGIEKVLLYGDENGDYLNEINFTTGKPLMKIQGTGTFRIKTVRAGGKSVLESGWIWEPLFVDPQAALRVRSNVNGNGVSGSILGEPKAGSSCGEVVDIMYDIWGGTIEYGGDLGIHPRIEASTGIYPMSVVEPVIKKKATINMIGSMNIDESEIITSEENPGIVYINGDGKTTNLTGFGVLFVNGNFEFAGNLDWNGLILVNGDLTFSGGGTKTIDGAVVAFGDAVALNGSVDIQYDCDLLKDLNDLHSGYKRVYWKEVY